MKKGVKITLIVVPIVLVVSLGLSFVGTLVYTQNNITNEVGEATVTSFISEVIIIFPPSVDYTGYIVTETPFEITNGGLYNIVDLVITVKVYGQNFTITSLNEKLLGQGENTIGNVPKGETWTGSLEINMTLDIALMAINDGNLRIDAEISLFLDFLIYKALVTSTETQLKPWDSPF
jgi:hypothetical protein